MKAHTDIQKELESMGSHLAGMSREMPYSVPEGYFDNLGENIAAAIKENTKEGLNLNASKAMPYGEVPTGYFDQLPARMLEVAKSAQARQPQVMALTPKTQHKQVTLRRVNWAVAAVLLITIGMGAYTYLFRQGEAIPDKLISSVSNNELHEYLQNTCRIDVDRVVNSSSILDLHLESKDIINYLDETGWDVVD